MTTAKNEILFIDANVLDKESLIAELSSNIHVVVLDDKTPVIHQIATVLEGYQNLDAIHIVSHGAEGELVFANGIINNANVSDYATQLKRIGSALSVNGDLLLYGCDVAKGEKGLAFIDTIAALTGADVAASNDLTGGLSGDWVLESTTGNIGENAIISEIYKYDLITTVTRTIGGGTLAVTPKENYYINEVSNSAYAAIKSDGSVVTWWGGTKVGGDSNSVASQLNGAIDVVQIYSSSSAFAALRVDGSVITWGSANQYDDVPIDRNMGQSTLDGSIDVTKIYSTSGAFAAIRTDGSVVTWGLPYNGGDSSVSRYDYTSRTIIKDYSVSNELNGNIDVVDIYSNNSAFAALRSDGSVVTWGETYSGGDGAVYHYDWNSNAYVKDYSVANQLDGRTNVTKIFKSNSAFVALRDDGSVITWGSADSGGNSSAVSNQLNGDIDVINVYSNGGAFAALRNDGSVVVWGDYWSGGTIDSNVKSQLNGNIDVIQIYPMGGAVGAFAALRADGSVVTWGNFWYMEPGLGTVNANPIKVDLSKAKVVKIYSNDGSYAALCQDGSVVTWGTADYGADGYIYNYSMEGKQGYVKGGSVSQKIDGVIDVVEIYSTSMAYAALRSDGSVVTWGRADEGGDDSVVANQLTGKVKAIYSNNDAFAALLNDGSVVTWGAPLYGGDISWKSEYPGDDSINLAKELDGTIDVQQIISNGSSFSALRSDGSVITWGNDWSWGYRIAKQSSSVVSFANADTDDVYKTPMNNLPVGIIYINGTASQGQKLTTSSTISDADGMGVISYQWLRYGSIINGASESSYTLMASDANTSISVKASYVDGFGTYESVISKGVQVASIGQLSVNSSSVNEGDSRQTNLTFTLTLSQALQQSGTLDYTLQSGTATSGIDFSANSGSVQFNAGETSKMLTVSVLGDTNVEGDETFNLVLSNPRNIEFSTGSNTLTAVGTIRNDDFPTLTLSNAPSVQEGNSGQSALIFTVKLSDAALSDLSVDYATQNATATAGQDFTAQSGTLKFTAGEKEKTITIPALGDTTDEADETLTLVVNNPKNVKFTGNVTELRSTGTILNDDGQSVRLSSPSITEGDSGISSMKFVLSIDHAVSNAVSFDYKTEEGTATADTDYATSSGIVTIPVGSLSTEITITVLSDTRIESNETFKLALNNPKGITLISTSLPLTSVGTIIDDDFPSINIPSTKTVYEPATGLKRWDIPITLSTTASIDSVISYHTQSGSAIQDKDFLNSSGKMTISANSDSGVISVPIIADTEKELDETFSLIIDGIEGGARFPVGQTSMRTDITISSNSIPTLTVQNVESIEGDTGNKSVVFKVNLSSTSTQTVSFTVKTVDKTASAGSDYQAINATIKTMPAGTQSLEISVPILGDKNAEGDEVFNLELSKISNAVFDSGVDTLMVKGTILDDDKPIIRIEDVHVVEGNGGIHDAKIKVTLSTLAATQVTLHYKSIDATAKAGEDYISTEEDLIIPAGAKEGYISVSIQGDTIPEAAQDFHIQLSSSINAQFLNAAATIQNTVTIDSDDGDNLPIVTVSKNLAIDEGDSGLTDFPITLKLSSPATDTLTIQYQTIAVDAIASSDFISTSSTVTFLVGDTSQTILLSIYGDKETESDEDFTLLLTDPQGMRFSSGLPSQEITLLIQDDDAEPAQILQGTPKNDILDATTDGAGTGDDSLNGLKGIDTMIGGDGDDTYFVDNIKDSIIEEDQAQSNAGDDDLVHSIATAYTLPVNVEHLIIDGKSKGNGTGNVLDNKLIGNLAVNVLSGLAGNDTLDGGSGNDALTGGLGNDTFIFASGIKGNKNIDTVKDFVHGEDKLYLSATIFSKLAAAVKFVDGNAPVSLANAESRYLVSAVKVKAIDTSSYLLYDTKTGVLSYDEDGSGKLTASSFVTLTGKPVITLEDLWIC